jgi:hypothetical protein
MKELLIITMALAVANVVPPADHGGVALLSGYTVSRLHGVDVGAVKYSRPAGPALYLECGLDGLWADPARKADYLWIKSQKVNGRTAYFALPKKDKQQAWKTNKTRSGEVLLASFQLSDTNPDHVANFRVYFNGNEELTEILLILMTFDSHNTSACGLGPMTHNPQK